MIVMDSSNRIMTYSQYKNSRSGTEGEYEPYGSVKLSLIGNF